MTTCRALVFNRNYPKLNTLAGDVYIEMFDKLGFFKPRNSPKAEPVELWTENCNVQTLGVADYVGSIRKEETPYYLMLESEGKL